MDGINEQGLEEGVDDSFVANPMEGYAESEEYLEASDYFAQVQGNGCVAFT